MTIDAVVLSVAMAVAAGLAGCFAIMRRMTLAGDDLFDGVPKLLSRRKPSSASSSPLW